MPQVHHYHPDTGLYLGSTDADESPLEPGVYLIPANSTLDEPPQPGANQSPVFSNNQWALVSDYRGYHYWLPDGSEYTIVKTGEEPPVDALTDKPPKSPEEIQQEIQQTITTSTQQRLDDFAQTRRYSNTDSLSKYKDITDEEIAALPAEEQTVVTRYRTECRYLVLKIAQTWAVLERIESEVMDGARPMPSGYADIEAELPVLVWPV